MAKKKILVIDDDPDIIEFTKVVLEASSYDISSAATKKEGIEKIDKELPDLIILDVMMDKMSDGFDLSRELKSDEKCKHIPIIVITAVGDMTGFRFSHDGGDREWLPVEAYLEKPISAEKLVSKVERLLKGT